MLYPVIINKFQRAPQNEFGFGRKSPGQGNAKSNDKHKQTKQKEKQNSNRNKKQKKPTSWKQQIDVTRSPLLSHSIPSAVSESEWQLFFADLLQV